MDPAQQQMAADPSAMMQGMPGMEGTTSVLDATLKINSPRNEPKRDQENDEENDEAVESNDGNDGPNG